MQLSVKDVVYLSIEGNVLGDGFRLSSLQAIESLQNYPRYAQIVYFSILC